MTVVTSDSSDVTSITSTQLREEMGREMDEIIRLDEIDRQRSQENLGTLLWGDNKMPQDLVGPRWTNVLINDPLLLKRLNELDKELELESEKDEKSVSSASIRTKRRAMRRARQRQRRNAGSSLGNQSLGSDLHESSAVRPGSPQPSQSDTDLTDLTSVSSLLGPSASQVGCGRDQWRCRLELEPNEPSPSSSEGSVESSNILPSSTSLPQCPNQWSSELPTNSEVSTNSNHLGSVSSGAPSESTAGSQQPPAPDTWTDFVTGEEYPVDGPVPPPVEGGEQVFLPKFFGPDVEATRDKSVRWQMPIGLNPDIRQAAAMSHELTVKPTFNIRDQTPCSKEAAEKCVRFQDGLYTHLAMHAMNKARDQRLMADLTARARTYISKMDTTQIPCDLVLNIMAESVAAAMDITPAEERLRQHLKSEVQGTARAKHAELVINGYAGRQFRGSATWRRGPSFFDGWLLNPRLLPGGK